MNFCAAQAVGCAAACPISLTTYYAQNGSWAGIGTWVAANQPAQPDVPGGQPHGQPPFLLADATERIVYAVGAERIGQTLAGDEHSSAQSLVVNGVIVGYLTRDLDRPGAMAGPELDFLSQLRTSLLIAGVVASLLGLAFGLVISRTLAAPLALPGAGRTRLRRPRSGTSASR